MPTVQRLCHSRVVIAICCVLVCLGALGGWAAMRRSATAASKPGRSARYDYGDRFRDGTPDFLRLDTPADRDAFRRWFTWLAERQAALPPERRAPEVADCAALLRYAYAGALHRHDDAWFAMAGLGQVPALPSIAKYAPPRAQLGPNVFRVRRGEFQSADILDGTFAQFAGAKTLLTANTHMVGRDLALARPGDLLFFRQIEQQSPFHSMIFVGRSYFVG